MQLNASIAIAQATLLLSGCHLLRGTPDVGIPDDWATEPIPINDVEVVETTCGEHLPPQQWVGPGLWIDYPSYVSGEPEFSLKFGDGRRHRCITHDEAAPYSFECDLDQPRKEWVNHDERDWQGFADYTIGGTFAGPREAAIDLTFDVNDCPRESSCLPYPAPCKVSVRMTYSD